MARKSSGKKKHGTRAKPLLHKATKTLSGKYKKARAKARKHYVANRRKILARAKKYYHTHKSRILRKQKAYRRKLKSGKAPLYKHGGVGGRYPRYKRFARTGGRRKRK